MRVLKESFNAGEFTPKLYSRYELSKYKNGCKTLTNFVPLPHGPVARRPGTKYVTEVKTSSKYTRLIPFVFSEDDAYIIEAGDQYFRFYRNNGQIQGVDSDTKLLLHFDGANNSTTINDDGDTGHTCTANGDAKLKTAYKKFGTASCYFDGTGDYISVPDHADWTFGAGKFTVDFWVRYAETPSGTDIYFEHETDADNDYKAYWSSDTLYFGVRDTGVDEVLLSYSWTPTVDTWYHIAVIRGWGGNANDWALCLNGEAVDTDTVNHTIDDYTGTFNISGAAAFAVKGYIDEFRVSKGTARWTANFAPPTSAYPFGDDSGTAYEIATTYTEPDLPNLHFVQSGDVMYIVNENYVVRKLTRSDHASWAIADVTFTTPPAAWSANDYPRTIDFYEDRLCFGGSPDQPDTIWTSDVGDYETFTAGGADDAAITLTLSARRVNDIKWLSSARRLLIGTGGEEWWASGPSDTEPITPSNQVAKKDSGWGSNRLMPIDIGDAVFYCQKKGRKVRELRYDFNRDRYISTDLSVLAEHLTENYSITSFAYQEDPYKILWCVRSDGTLLSLTYLQEHDVIAWATHTSGSGLFKYVASIPGDIEDQVWFVIERVVDGSTVQYIEYLGDFNFGSTLGDAFFVDSGLTYEGASASTISGMDHLEGESVDILSAGSVVTGKSVSSGDVTLDTASTKVHIGLNYVPELETLEAATEDREGPLQGYSKQITNIIIQLVNSQGGLYGPDSSTTDPIEYKNTTLLYTGWTEDQSFDEGSDASATVYIKCDKPLPLQVAAILIDIDG